MQFPHQNIVRQSSAPQPGLSVILVAYATPIWGLTELARASAVRGWFSRFGAQPQPLFEISFGLVQISMIFLAVTLLSRRYGSALATRSSAPVSVGAWVLISSMLAPIFVWHVFLLLKSALPLSGEPPRWMRCSWMRCTSTFGVDRNTVHLLREWFAPLL